MYWINLCIPWESKDTAHLKDVIKEVIKRCIKDVAYTTKNLVQKSSFIDKM